MPEMLLNKPEDYYLEEWEVVQNGVHYILTHNQSQILKKELAAGNRGNIMFPDFSINIPFIQNFHKKRKYINPKYILPAPKEEPVKPLTPEQQRKIDERKLEIREKMKGWKTGRQMTAREIENRKTALAEQAKKLQAS
jgi:hypothetical protein